MGDTSTESPGQTTSMQQITSSELHLILNISPDALVLVNQEGRIIRGNEQAELLFGYSEQALRTLSLEQLLPYRFREQHRTHRRHYAATPRSRPMGVGLQLFGLRKDGTEFPVDISLRPLMIDGKFHTLAAVRDESLRSAAERERAAQAQHLRLLKDLVNLASDAILLRDPISRILFWNQGAQELYGWSSQEALGRISHTLLKTCFPYSRAALDASLEQSGQWEGILVHTRRDGSIIMTESRQVLVRDDAGQPLAVLEINRDITERTRLEQTSHTTHTSIGQGEMMLQQVLDALPVGIFLVAGQDAHLLFANRTAYCIWGVQWELQQPLSSFLDAHHISLLNQQRCPLPETQFAAIRALRLGETVANQQETIRRPDGSLVPVLMQAVPFLLPEEWQQSWMSGGEPVALVICQDITVLKEADYLKDEFVSIAAHELRTPLSVLAGYVQLLLYHSTHGSEASLNTWQQEALTEINLATDRLSTLIEDLLDVTRLQTGQLILQPSSINVVPLVRRIARDLQLTTDRHQIRIQVERDIVVTSVDTGRFEQIMTNLIGNALKYSPEGGVVTITIATDLLLRQMRLTIQDQGIGIPRQQHGRIFGRFMRAENAQAWGIHGTGLGLYLCRELIERLGGHLWFESEEGKGSTFFVAFPLETTE